MRRRLWAPSFFGDGFSGATPHRGIPLTSPQPIQSLLERDVSIEIVTPMLAGTAQALAFDHPLEFQDNLGARSRVGSQCLGEIEMTGDLQSRQLASLRGRSLLFPEEFRDFMTKSVHVPGSLPILRLLWEQGGARGQIWRRIDELNK